MPASIPDEHLVQHVLAELPTDSLTEQQYQALWRRDDARFGAYFFMVWVKIQAQRRGVIETQITEQIADRIAEATRELDGDVDDDRLHLARALAVASQGQWERAGKIFRLILSNGAHVMVREKLATFGLNMKEQRAGYSRMGNASKKASAKAKQGAWLQLGKPLRERHPSKPNTWLAKQIAQKTGDSESSIRAALPSLGLSPKKI